MFIQISTIMSKGHDTAKRESSQKYVLCQMPPGWTTLPVCPRLPHPPPQDSIAVYTKNGLNKNLIYEGYICPKAPEKLSMSALLAPQKQQRQLSFGQKYEKLQEKIRAEEAEADAQERNMSEDQKSREADSAASSQPGRGVVKAELSTMSGGEDTADESKPQIKEEAAFTSESESNINYPLPFEILDMRESFLPALATGGTEEFMYYSEPCETTVDTDFLNCLCIKDYS
ncbi:uncharacterized protein LOC130182900 [Seriola aureovittata]|uniref:uncharacterized protein LOC130182900 n=1 Tax=Seriola aureovittata TaxID=2871759 RepID=UPI0024BE9757|nr:uncharacterized protein LOC130182900 [Seriola aureovittata]